MQLVLSLKTLQKAQARLRVVCQDGKKAMVDAIRILREQRVKLQEALARKVLGDLRTIKHWH